MALMTEPRRHTVTNPGPLFWLLSLWSLGLICGAWFSTSAGDAYLSLMRSATCARMSIFSLLGTLLLPFMISALAVLMDAPILIFFISFAKGFSFSFVSLGTVLAFPAGGWLVRWLLMFSDVCVNPVLLFFMFRCLARKKGSLLIPAVGVCGYVFLAAAIDHRYIAPFLLELMKY